MKLREFLSQAAATGVLAGTTLPRVLAADEHATCHPTYGTVQDAMRSAPERHAFVPTILTGTKSRHPDYLSTVDLDPNSKTYGQIVSRFSMPTAGDELHHYGWNACSSCHGERHRRYLIVPGLGSGNIYVVDALHPTKLVLHKTISNEEIARKTNLSTPHTVHCRADGVIMISMLGDAQGDVSDPIGGTTEVYRKCAEQIEGFLKPRIEELDLPSVLAAGGLEG